MHQKYFPLLKTTDAELKGYEKLSTSIKEGILPIFELTRSRRSKKNIDGKLEKRISQLVDIVGERPFILDLTADIDLSNQELSEMLSSTKNGHEKWRVFAKNLKSQGLNIIPVIHYNENAPEESIREAQELEKEFELIAFRSDAKDEDMLGYVKPILDGLKDPKKLLLILDMGFIPKNGSMANNNSSIYSIISSKIDQLIKLNNKPSKYIPMFSSFPKSVREYGDSTGEIPWQEVQISEKLCTDFPHEPIDYGDYASVHPDRYPGGGGVWIPRIDFPLEKSCFFHRSRVSSQELTKDAYVRVAKAVMADSKFMTFQSSESIWGIEEIKIAANGTPNGKSPSYWIAVRICLHITRQYFRCLNV